MTGRERLEAASDRDVLAAIASGSQDALEVLYARLGQRLFRFLVGLVGGDAARAEDAMSEAFFEVWRRAPTFRGDSAVRTWVFGIARHKALSLVRRQRPSEPDEALEAVASGEPDVLSGMMEDEAREQVRQALDALSPEHREVIELSLYQNFTYEEIAEIVGCPVNTVKTRAFNARRQLKRRLAGLAGTER